MVEDKLIYDPVISGSSMNTDADSGGTEVNGNHVFQQADMEIAVLFPEELLTTSCGNVCFLTEHCHAKLFPTVRSLHVFLRDTVFLAWRRRWEELPSAFCLCLYHFIASCSD